MYTHIHAYIYIHFADSAVAFAFGFLCLVIPLRFFFLLFLFLFGMPKVQEKNADLGQEREWQSKLKSKIKTGYQVARSPAKYTIANKAKCNNT